MTPAGPRPTRERQADAVTMLTTPGIDAWVASAGPADDGEPRAHLVPLTLAWLDERVVIALELSSLTARNLVRHGRARLAVGPTRDVVMIDAVLEVAVPVGEAPAELADGYAAQSDWEPRRAGDGYAYLVLRPQRIQAWRDEGELAGRTIMRHAAWVE